MRTPSTPLRPVIAVVYPGVEMLDVMGPLDIFAAANEFRKQQGRRLRPEYSITVLSPKGKVVVASNGLTIAAHGPIAGGITPVDTLLVPGAFHIDPALRDRELLAWIRMTSARARRVVSVCSGAFLLAQAGLLNGRRAVTHWAGCRRLAQMYPKVRVEADPIFLRDGHIYTSAGVTAGLDLALALVEEDMGRAAALEIARWFVMYLKRPGGQAQFSAPLQGQLSDRQPIREAVEAVTANPAREHTVATMAKRAAMSPRHFARVFLTEAGITPAAYVSRMRLEAARRRLEESQDRLKTIAESCGFGSAESLRRAFQRTLQTTPGEYRARFRRE